MNIKKWKFWYKIKLFSEKRMTNAWFENGNCDSACPNCKQYESLGNVIKTEPMEDGTENRSCSNCGHKWKTIFTPAGFIEIK